MSADESEYAIWEREAEISRLKARIAQLEAGLQEAKDLVEAALKETP